MVEHAAFRDLTLQVRDDPPSQQRQRSEVGVERFTDEAKDSVPTLGRSRWSRASTHASCGAITRFPFSSSANATPSKLAGRRRNGAKWLIGVEATRRSGRSLDTI